MSDHFPDPHEPINAANISVSAAYALIVIGLIFAMAAVLAPVMPRILEVLAP